MNKFSFWSLSVCILEFIHTYMHICMFTPTHTHTDIHGVCIYVCVCAYLPSPFVFPPRTFPSSPPRPFVHPFLLASFRFPSALSIPFLRSHLFPFRRTSRSEFIKPCVLEVVATAAGRSQQPGCGEGDGRRHSSTA